MARLNGKPQTLGDKLYASVELEQREQVKRLLIGFIRGSDRIEGVHRSSNSYGVKSPRDLPRIPREDR